jgi:hypothetical protein
VEDVLEEFPLGRELTIEQVEELLNEKWSYECLQNRCINVSYDDNLDKKLVYRLKVLP